MLDIDFQHTYVIDSWTQYRTEADTAIPATTFGFKNKIPASAAVELYIGGKYVPGESRRMAGERRGLTGK